MNPSITINGKHIGQGYPTYIVAEMSANHNQSFEAAVRIIEAAKERKGLFARILKSQLEYLNEYKDWREMTGKFGFGFHPTYTDKVLGELEKMGIK